MTSIRFISSIAIASVVAVTLVGCSHEATLAPENFEKNDCMVQKVSAYSIEDKSTLIELDTTPCGTILIETDLVLTNNRNGNRLITERAYDFTGVTAYKDTTDTFTATDYTLSEGQDPIPTDSPTPEPDPTLTPEPVSTDSPTPVPSADTPAPTDGTYDPNDCKIFTDTLYCRILLPSAPPSTPESQK